MSTGKMPSRPGAREGLIETHLPLVRAVARRYAGRGAELDDLVQAGSVGLVKASRRFDPARGVSFATFATPTIEGEIRHHLRDRVAAVRVPRDVQALAARISRREPELAGSLGRAPSAAELADALEVPVEAVQWARQLPRQTDLLGPDLGEEPPSGEGDGESAVARLLLAEHLRALDERERQVVYLRFHRDLTERQIAEEIGISQAQVSRLLTRALDTLRARADGADVASGPSPAPAPSSPSPPGSPPRQTRSPSETSTARGGRRASYSGRFLVRMPSELHQALAQAAQQRDVSLNRYVVDALGAALEPGSGAAGSNPAEVRADSTPRRAEARADSTPRPSRPARAAALLLAADTIVLAIAALVALGLLVLVLVQGT